MSGGDAVAQSVSSGLRDAFAEVVAAGLPPDETGRWHHRLLAITNTAKRDVVRARDQLHRFEQEWNALLMERESSE